jgi:DNA repair exonuclease SbcCD ATPase subunit
MSEEQVTGVEQEARTLGWVPQEEFKGDLARWVDAETFVERGHTVMPILRKNNERLEQLVKSQAEELNKVKNLFSASQESITELQKVHADAMKAAVEKARRDVMAEIRTAREDGDVERELQLTDELADLKNQQKTLENKPQEPAAPAQAQQQEVHPDLKAWMEENPWFGTDQRKTMKAMGIAQVLRADPDNEKLQGREFFDRVLEELEGKTTARTDKVSGGRPTGTNGGGGGGGGKAYADMPSDAKEACDRQGRKLVGEGRAFKDMAAWRSYYANLYFQGA